MLSLSVSYFFYLGVCFALFMFFMMLGGFRFILKSIQTIYRLAKSMLTHNDPELALKENPDSTMSRRSFMRYTASGGALAIVGMGLHGLDEAYEPPKADLIEISNSALEGLTRPIDIIQITDLHYGMFYSNSNLEALVSKLNSINGDAVVITGDIFHSPSSPVESAVPYLRQLRPRRWGNFAILGNHDFYAGVRRCVKAIRDSGLRLLRNEWITFREDGANIHMGGIDDPQVNWLTGKEIPNFGPFIKKKPVDPGFLLLLSHRPVVFPLAVKANVQLTLSGHTHGGQITFPAPGVTRPWSVAGLVSPYTLGMYKSQNCQMYLNRGVGLTFIPVRINCPPEIAVIRLTASGKNSRKA
ncbi:MAG: metallophosphoesterase [Desulfomonilaceae bacterium]